MPEYRLTKHRGQISLAYNDDERGRVRVALGTNDSGLAEARAREWWWKHTAPTTDRVADLWTAYIADRSIDVVDIGRLGNAWKSLEPHFGHKLGTAIEPQDCRDYEKARLRLGRAASTIRTELEYLRACLNKKYGRGNVRVWTPPASKPRQRYLTKEEANKLLDSIETPHVRLFVLLAIATGARMTALLDLTWDRVDFDRKMVDLEPAGRRKTNKGRTVVPVNQRAWEALELAHAGRMSDFVIEHGGRQIVSIKKAIRSAAVRSGIPCSPHVFRHTAGVWAAEAGASMAEIAQYLGHTNTKMTEKVYARFSPVYLKKVSEMLEW